MSNKTRLKRFVAPTEMKLSLLWASLMFLYIYNDYFSLYSPGTIESMTEGVIGPGWLATGGTMVAISGVLAIPAVMIFLSAALPAHLSRWTNVLLGIFYTGIQALTFPGSETFYQMVVVLEILVTLLIIWSALRWPREPAR